MGLSSFLILFFFSLNACSQFCWPRFKSVFIKNVKGVQAYTILFPFPKYRIVLRFLLKRKHCTVSQISSIGMFHLVDLSTIQCKYSFISFFTDWCSPYPASVACIFVLFSVLYEPCSAVSSFIIETLHRFCPHFFPERPVKTFFYSVDKNRIDSVLMKTLQFLPANRWVPVTANAHHSSLWCELCPHFFFYQQSLALASENLWKSIWSASQPATTTPRMLQNDV